MEIKNIFLIFILFSACIYAEDRLNYQLYEACKTGDINKVRTLIRRGVNVNEKSDFLQDTALKLAARYGYTEIVKLLIANKANVNLNAPIVYAADEGYYDIVKVLIDNKADINQFNKFGYFVGDSYRTVFYNALMVSIKNGYINIANLLIQNKAKINITNDYGYTPLSLAVSGGYIDTAILLINNGANFDKEYYSSFAIVNDYNKFFISLLDKKLNVNYALSNANNSSLLTYAVDKNATNIIKTLIERKADTSIRNNNGRTAFDIAMSKEINNRKNIMKLFLNSYIFDNFKKLISEANIDNTDIAEINKMVMEDSNLYLDRSTSFGTHSFNKGDYLLSLLITLKHYDIATNLIEIGYLDINKQTKNYTPLIYAIENNDIESVKFLINSKADIDLPTYYEYSNSKLPLNYAIENSNIEIASLLLNAGCNREYTYNGKTPLIHAIEKGNYDMVKLLLDKKVKVNSRGGEELYLAVKDNKLEIAEALINAKADINARYNDDKTCLMIASEKGYKEMVELLINKGANLNINNDNGDSALSLAINNKNMVIADILLSKGAKISEELKSKLEEIKQEEERKIKEEEDRKTAEQKRIEEEKRKNEEMARIRERNRRIYSQIEIANSFNTAGYVFMVGGVLTAASPFVIDAIKNKQFSFDFLDFNKKDKASILNRSLFFAGVGLFTAGALTSIISSATANRLSNKLAYSFYPIILKNDFGILDYGYAFNIDYKF
ncbi:ankyrin repeat domain-containing protein [Brachyspira aalborgi]|uniref:Uncharacterized protein n=1 Tax=Brachyspira aalborgi TaxID=29522 RepID=A0A5C8FXT1_9SPIR|nr:ankyrin repeat domain-containing protein [Brachyspira aalborgi]TXJ54490.1 hypothetical protein EPJ76_09175 [Brachyspira aalborgi]